MGLRPHFCVQEIWYKNISYTRRLRRFLLYALCFVLYYLNLNHGTRNRI
jgi:hypothetical protein